MKTLLFYASFCICLLGLTACSQKTSFMEQDHLQAEGNYNEAILHAKKKIDKHDKSARDNLLWELYLGQSYFFSEAYGSSISIFDEAEGLMKYHRERLLSIEYAKDVGALLSNDNIRPYMGNEYDGIMINTYKALAYLNQKEYASARVEFNRAIDRQRRAKEFFAELISKEKELLAKEQQNQNISSNLSEEVQSERYQSILHRNYPELSSYRLYPAFVNPMTNYLAALFALANGERAKAEFLLKESAAMLGENTAVQEDFEALQKEESRPTIWLVYEEGLAPVLEEMRIDFPVWIFTNQLNYVSLALPRMQERSDAFEKLLISHDGKQIAQTQMLSSMERVMQTEFTKRYSSIMERALYSALVKSMMQYRAGDSGNNLLAFSATLYTLLSTQADTRIWSSLPKNFHLARFENKGYERVDIHLPSGDKISSIKLLPVKYMLIYVKIPTLAHLPKISIFSLGETQ